ncbi:TPA: hypothetical protein ACFNM3_000360 [Neisseria lactamica]
MPSEAFSGFRRHLVLAGRFVPALGFCPPRRPDGERRFPFPVWCCRYGWRRFA